jgi:hypothetical protein
VIPKEKPMDAWTLPRDPPAVAGRLIARAWAMRDTAPVAPPLQPWDDLTSAYWPDCRASDRLQDGGIAIDIQETGRLATLLGLPPVLLCWQPDPGTTHAVMTRFTTPVDVTALLIELATWGLPLDPMPWVRAIRPTLQRKQRITPTELRIVWFAREQRRFHASLERIAWPADFPPVFATANGRLIVRDGAGACSLPENRQSRVLAEAMAMPPLRAA